MAFGSVGVVGGLIVVQVAILGGRHDDIVPRAGRLDRPANPIHHDGVLGQAALADFAPADQVASLGIDELLDAADEVALQLVLVLQALLFDAGLAAGALLPILLGHLVAADVDVLGRETGTGPPPARFAGTRRSHPCPRNRPPRRRPLRRSACRVRRCSSTRETPTAPRSSARAFRSPARR